MSQPESGFQYPKDCREAVRRVVSDLIPQGEIVGYIHGSLFALPAELSYHRIFSPAEFRKNPRDYFDTDIMSSLADGFWPVLRGEPTVDFEVRKQGEELFYRPRGVCNLLRRSIGLNIPETTVEWLRNRFGERNDL